MAKGNNGDANSASAEREIRGLELPAGEYIVVDVYGHEAFVPYRVHDERVYHRPLDGDSSLTSDGEQPNCEQI